MPIPLVVYAAPIGYGIATGAVAAYFIKTSDGAIAEATEDAANAAVDAGAELVTTTLSELAPILEDAAIKLKDAGIDFLKFAGPAIIEGIGNTYQAARGLLKGKEDDIIAGFTIGFMALITLVFLYQSAKKGGA